MLHSDRKSLEVHKICATPCTTVRPHCPQVLGANVVQKSLSDLTLRSLPQGEFWDTKLPSFGVRVGRRATTFLLKKNGRRVKLGRYPSLGLAEARRRAFALKADRDTVATTITLAEALRLFYDTHCTHYRPKVLYETKRYLAKLSTYDSHKLTKLTTQHLFQIIDGQTRAEANKLFTVSRTFFRFCTRRRLIDRSPLEGLGIPNKETARARVLTDAELKKIWDACDDRQHSLPDHFRTIVQLLTLTGMRRGEAAALRPSYIDLVRRTICLPSTLVKNSREHLFPIGALTAELLSKAPKPAQDSDFIFPARGNAQTSFNGWSKSKTQLDSASSVKDWTLHDMRRTFATTLAKLGTPIHVVEKLLNHVSGTTGGLVAVYQKHQYWDEQVVAVQKYEAHLKTVLQLA